MPIFSLCWWLSVSLDCKAPYDLFTYVTLPVTAGFLTQGTVTDLPLMRSVTYLFINHRATIPSY